MALDSTEVLQAVFVGGLGGVCGELAKGFEAYRKLPSRVFAARLRSVKTYVLGAISFAFGSLGALVANWNGHPEFPALLMSGIGSFALFRSLASGASAGSNGQGGGVPQGRIPDKPQDVHISWRDVLS